MLKHFNFISIKSLWYLPKSYIFNTKIWSYVNGLTQEQDRERLVIANSIDDVNKELKMKLQIWWKYIYEWVDYSTLVGINYLYYG